MLIYTSELRDPQGSSAHADFLLENRENDGLVQGIHGRRCLHPVWRRHQEGA